MFEASIQSVALYLDVSVEVIYDLIGIGAVEVIQPCDEPEYASVCLAETLNAYDKHRDAYETIDETELGGEG